MAASHGRLAVSGAIVRLVAARACLRFLSFERALCAFGITLNTTRASYRRNPSELSKLPDDLQHPTRLILSACRRYPGRASCLERALALGSLLRCKQPILMLGVAKSHDALTAHAWLRVDDHVIDVKPRGLPQELRVLGNS